MIFRTSTENSVHLDSLIYSSANKKVSFAVMPELIFKDKNEVTLVIKKKYSPKGFVFSDLDEEI